MRINTLLLALFTVIFSVGTAAYGQPLDEQKWEELTRDLDYEEESRDNKIEFEFEDPSKPGPIAKFFYSLLQILPYILLGIAVLVILYFIVKNFSGRGDKKIAKNLAADLEKAEDRLEETDLTKLLLKAVKIEDYRSALRIYYLMTLKLLTQKNAVRYEKRKTNHEYILELRSTSFQMPFKILTYSFDLFWYGGKPLSKEQFKREEARFKELLTAIKNEE